MSKKAYGAILGCLLLLSAEAIKADHVPLPAEPEPNPEESAAVIEYRKILEEVYQKGWEDGMKEGVVTLSVHMIQSCESVQMFRIGPVSYQCFKLLRIGANEQETMQ